MFELGNAVCYQGYRKEHSLIEGTYPSKTQVLEDLLIIEKEFNYIRVYDTSLHTRDILELIDEHQLNIKVMLSMYMFVEENHINHPIFNTIDNDILDRNIIINNELCKEVSTLANKYKDIVFSVSVGNEARSTWNVNRVSDARIALLVKTIQKEIEQPVTFCEEWKYWLKDLPLTAKAVDFISIHSYPVWNDVEIKHAVKETNDHFTEVKLAHPNKEIIITEAGWPTKTDEKQIPKTWATIENQNLYYRNINIWAKEKNTLVFIFEAFDEYWKGSDNPNDPEKNWGLFNNDRVRKSKKQ